MINEVWLIHNGICLYHKIFKDTRNPNFTGLNLDSQLFAGFISAILNFTKQQLNESNSLQKISFNEGIYEIVQVEDILAVLSLNLTYLSEQKLKQSVISLTNEIQYFIQTNDKLSHLRMNNKIKARVLPLNEYHNIFESFIEKVLDEIYQIQNQLLMVDILTLIQILEDLKILLDRLKISSKIIEYTLCLSPLAQKVLKNIEIIKKEDINSLYTIQKEFKEMIQKSLKSINQDELLNNKDNFENYKRLFMFIKKNYSIIKQFQLEDLLFKEFLALI